MKMGRIIILFILMISTLQVQAKAPGLEANSGMSVEWQAIKLQESIEAKIIRSLNPIIKESEYVIEVKIGFNAEDAEEPTTKKIIKNKQVKKVQFSNSEFPKDGDDFIVFNKLGLEAPLIGEEPVEIETSEVEQTQRAMIEMNDRYNLFNYLNSIDINLTFDKGLSDKTKDSIKKIISGLSFNTRDIIPQINTQYIEIKDARVKSAEEERQAALAKNTKEPEKVAPPKWYEKFKNLDIMIGLIVSAFLLGLVALIIARKGSKHEELQESKSENDNTGANEDMVNAEESTEEEHDPEQEEDDMTLDLTRNDPQTVKIIAGLERFRKTYNNHYPDTMLLLKSWIKAGKGEEAEALKALVAILTDAELGAIFKALTIDERGAWKMCLNSEMNKDELARAFTFISNKIIEALMVPSLIDDYEVCDLLLDLSAEDAARFCIDHPELGGVFANVLSSKVIGQMFDIMSVDAVADIIERSSRFKQEEVISRMPLLKEKLIEIKFKRERPPFLKRIFDILPTAKIEIEKKLYSTMLYHCSWEDVRDTALKILPLHLTSTISEGIFKNVINSMPLDKQVLYFAVVDDESREEKLSLFAPKGAKNREMLDIELETILKNEVFHARLMSDRKAEIEAEYVQSVRAFVGVNPEAQIEMKGEVERWLREIKEAEEQKTSTNKNVSADAA